MTHGATCRGHMIVVRDNHAALASGDWTAGEKTKARNAAKASDIVRAECGAKSLGSIFNHGNF